MKILQSKTARPTNQLFLRNPEHLEKCLKAFNGLFTDYRPSWDEFFILMAVLTGSRGTCDRGRSGCLIVSEDNRIISAGYVGSPSGQKHCDEAGHQLQTVILDGIKSTHCIRTVHAEMNAIAQAARLGISIKGATLYCTMEPCSVCAKAIIQAGIVRVIALYRYQRAEETRRLFQESNITLRVVFQKQASYGKKKR